MMDNNMDESNRLPIHDEHVKRLNEDVTFPAMMAIYYGLPTTFLSPTLQAVIIETKAKTRGNVRVASLGPTFGMSCAPFSWLLVDVYQFETADDYMIKLKELSDRFLIDLDNLPYDNQNK